MSWWFQRPWPFVQQCMGAVAVFRSVLLFSVAVAEQYSFLQIVILTALPLAIHNPYKVNICKSGLYKQPFPVTGVYWSVRRASQDGCSLNPESVSVQWQQMRHRHCSVPLQPDRMDLLPSLKKTGSHTKALGRLCEMEGVKTTAALGKLLINLINFRESEPSSEPKQDRGEPAKS